MAQPRRRKGWERLAESTRKRYLSAGRKAGLTDGQIQHHYVSGGSLSAWRGHKPRRGISEKRWATLQHAARRARLQSDADSPDVVLESMLDKGFTYQQILDVLREKEDSRREYRTTGARSKRDRGEDAGYQPGRRRFFARPLIADIELFWYH